MKRVAQKALYEKRKRRGSNLQVGPQHELAIAKSGSRLDELGKITLPVLIIHGKSDPLIDFNHCQKYAPLIPHAKKLFIDGMGHDMPDAYMHQYHKVIYELFEEADDTPLFSDN